jgi:hypothetical protein
MRAERKRALHFLNEDGMVACNPRDREAAHRAEVEGIATHNRRAVTCRKCLAALRRARSRPRPPRAGRSSPAGRTAASTRRRGAISINGQTMPTAGACCPAPSFFLQGYRRV